MSVSGIADVQQLTSTVVKNVGLPPDCNLVLLYEDPGTCTHSGSFAGQLRASTGVEFAAETLFSPFVRVRVCVYVSVLLGTTAHRTVSIQFQRQTSTNF